MTKYLLIASIFSLALQSAAQAPLNWSGPAESVYVVQPNTSGEGDGPTAAKFGDLLMVQIYPVAPQQQDGQRRIDGERLYKLGTEIPFHVDGERRGAVRIRAVKDHHCDSTAALVAPTLSTISKRPVGIATNAPGIKSRSGKRRPATATERSAAVRNATREFLRNNVATDLMTRINVQELEAIEVDGLESPILAGSFFIRANRIRHDVFLIVKLGQSMSLELSDYRLTTNLEDFKDHRSVSLIDHLDLNQDGTDELVLRMRGYESESFEIYTRINGQWRLAAVGGESGC